MIQRYPNGGRVSDLFRTLAYQAITR
jgi:hypothetical protein